MDFTARRQRLNLPVAPLVAALVGGATALVFTLMPVGTLEDFVLDSGIAAVMPAAEPPLGTTARAVLILAGGGGIALITWFTLFLLLGARAIVIQRSGDASGEERPLVLRRADAHPDAPARRPLFANRDLGTPFLEVRAGRPLHIVADTPPEMEPADAALAPPPVERAIPADLDTPLAAFDPDAIPPAVGEWPPRRAPLVDRPRWQDGFADRDPQPVASNPTPTRESPGDWLPMGAAPRTAPRQQLFDPGERFETFELTPPVRSLVPEPMPIAAAEPMSPPVRPRDSARVELDPSASIHALLDRLERVVGHREAVGRPTPPPPVRADSLEETLGTLRRLATGR